MKQRVKLAQALVGDPRLLLLDEPTNGLDPAGRDAMLELIARIGTEFGISIVVASHLLGEIERICDHLVAIEAGRLLRADTITSMTQVSQVLLVEVDEGSDELLAELAGRGLSPGGTNGRCWSISGRRRHVRHRPRRDRRPGPAAEPAGAAPPPGGGTLPDDDADALATAGAGSSSGGSGTSGGGPSGTPEAPHVR